MRGYKLAVLLAVLAPTGALAEPAAHGIQTGDGLVKMCNGADKVKALSMMCHSYLNGYIDAALFHDKGGRFCLGAGDKQRLPAVAITWINAHPDHLRKPAPEALAKLLAENYPCRK